MEPVAIKRGVTAARDPMYPRVLRVDVGHVCLIRLNPAHVKRLLRACQAFLSDVDTEAPQEQAS